MPVNFNATAARMAGGRGAPQTMVQPTVQAVMPSANPRGYGAAKPMSYGGGYKTAYDPYKLNRGITDDLYNRGRYTAGREVASNGAYDAAMADPTGQANMFQNFYGDATNALAAPILRKFQEALGANVGSTASRFGGQSGSTEQARGEFNTGDVFSRNLAEMIRGQAGQSVAAGMDWTKMLGDRAGAATSAEENNTTMRAGVAQGTKKPKSGLGSFLGGLVGAGVGAFSGGFGTGLGQKAG